MNFFGNLVGVSTAVLCVSCRAAPSTTDGALFARPTINHLHGDAPPINILARGWVVNGKQASHTFGYYSYLLFGSRGDETAFERRDAALAFLRLFDDVSSTLPAAGGDAHLAVVLAPVRGALEAKVSVSQLLDAYDYTYAALLRGNLLHYKLTVPLVSLVGSPRPITPDTTVDAKDLTIVNLCGGDAERVFEAFNDKLVANVDDVVQPEFSIAARMASFFDEVGKFIVSAGGGAVDDDSRCLPRRP